MPEKRELKSWKCPPVHARRLLSSPPNGNLVEALQTVFKSYRGDRWPTIAEAAELANMSVRSFQRELSAHGVVFSELVDGIRAELAEEMRQETDVSLAKIASALGYSTPSNFARAFERWTGLKPAVFRRGL